MNDDLTAEVKDSSSGVNMSIETDTLFYNSIVNYLYMWNL